MHETNVQLMQCMHEVPEASPVALVRESRTKAIRSRKETQRLAVRLVAMKPLSSVA